MFVGSTAADLKIGSNRVKAVRQGANLRYFRPDSLSGLEAWWDAADVSTVTLDGSDVVSVADKSGNSNTLAPPSAGVRPAYSASALNGKGGMVLTNGTDYLTAAVDGLSSFTGLTVFSVFKTTAEASADTNTGVFWSYGNFGSAGGGYPASTGVSSGSGTGSLSGETMVINVESGSAGRLGSSSYTRPAGTGSVEAVSTGAAGTAFYQYGNSVSLDLTAVVTAAGDHSPAQIGYTVDDDIHVGALRIAGVMTPLPATGTTTVCEQLVFSSQLSEADRQLVEGYLAHKWGLQSKLPYDHPYASSFYGVQSLPTDTDVLAFAAASGAVSIPDLLKIEDLVAYLKAESLWDYARFYPMKSAQNAGSGSTVYGLGGLTSNNMTLVNSPTWGSDGVTFASASSQYGNIGTLGGGESLELLARVAYANATPAAAEAVLGYYRSSALNHRYLRLDRLTGGEFRSLRSSSGTGPEVESISSSGQVNTTDMQTVVWSLPEGSNVAFYQNKTQLSNVVGQAGEQAIAAIPEDIFFAAVNDGVAAGTFSDFEASAALLFSGTIPTTPQREAIIDLINAL